MLPFEFQTAQRIIFGDGVVSRLGSETLRLGRRALLVTGSRGDKGSIAEELLRAAGLSVTQVSVAGEPLIADAERLVELARRMDVDVVVAFGGGSAIDLGKAAAGLVANDGEPLDYLEVIGKGQPLLRPALPFIAVPTTAGTGAEVTKNAVLGSRERGVKVSLRHDSLLPKLALVDPELTLSVPPDVTAATGLDAITQCLEPYLSCQANPLTDALALDGFSRGFAAIRKAFENGSDRDARRDLALCSLFGGLSLANAKLGAVHGFAAPIGGQFESPHGAVCARLLPLVFAANGKALVSRAPEHPALARMFELSRRMTGDADATIDDGVRALTRLAEDLGIPPLSKYGMSESDVAATAEKAARASSMKGNPIELRRLELEDILKRAL